MNLMDRLSDTDLDHAYFLSKLVPNPVKVTDGVYIWNGILLDRETAVVILLKMYSQLPVSTSAIEKLFENYKKKYQYQKYAVKIVSEQIFDNPSNWFYHICYDIRGNVLTRTAEDIKQQLINLHS